MRRRGVRPELVAALLLAAAAVTIAASRVSTLVQTADSALATPTPSLADSDIDPLDYFVTTGDLELAREWIPDGAYYTVVVGQDPPIPYGYTEAIEPVFNFWLLPRRETSDLRLATWVIAYHHPIDTIPVHVAREVSLGSDGALLEVER